MQIPFPNTLPSMQRESYRDEYAYIWASRYSPCGYPSPPLFPVYSKRAIESSVFIKKYRELRIIQEYGYIGASQYRGFPIQSLRIHCPTTLPSIQLESYNKEYRYIGASRYSPCGYPSPPLFPVYSERAIESSVCIKTYRELRMIYGVAVVRRIDKIIGLFCKRGL